MSVCANTHTHTHSVCANNNSSVVYSDINQKKDRDYSSVAIDSGSLFKKVKEEKKTTTGNRTLLLLPSEGVVENSWCELSKSLSAIDKYKSSTTTYDKYKSCSSNITILPSQSHTHTDEKKKSPQPHTHTYEKKKSPQSHTHTH
eukprot:GHVR01172833.1.p1 GENE.GHVR01172833.1~~GHVR01172833.1.p1  ORF type:complete len:144 (+),score=62.83 GHVR01172833.1:151-582(+)